jgi:hypothetical protein
MSTKYVLVYRGGGMPEGEAAREAVMAAWGQWYERLGSAVVDPGNPTVRSRTISPDGAVSGEESASISGYTILSADGLDAAVALARACPVLASGASIEVVEAPDMM